MQLEIEKVGSNKRSLVILILGLLSAIGPFSIDTYLSGFPIIANDLHVSNRLKINAVKLIVRFGA